MASSTPPPHCTITKPSAPPPHYSSTKPYQNNPYPHQRSLQNRSHNHSWTSHKVSLNHTSAAASAPAPPRPENPAFLSPLPTPPKARLAVDFCGKKSTRCVSKIYYNRTKSTQQTKHTPIAEEALQLVVQFARNNKDLENVLRRFERSLSGVDDYVYILKEMGKEVECSKVIHCYNFAISRDMKQIDKGKLVSCVISILGRLGKVDLARNVFDNAVEEGYGNTVFAYSSLISAYGRIGKCQKAFKVFDMMKEKNLRPNLVTYNAVIDACGKGGVEFQSVIDYYTEMLSNGVSPDRITFNSLLAACSRGGRWEAAMNLFYEMVDRGIEQDIFTYNTLLDAFCKCGQIELARQIMADMTRKKVMPNVVTYSTMIDGYAKCDRFEEALRLFNDMKRLGIALDRVSFNTMLSLYAKLGRFHEALNVCEEMDKAGIRKDVVTYNALLVGFGKQGKYEQVKQVFSQMKAQRVCPNLLTYSTLIDVYSKGGFYFEAMGVFREFKQRGLKADVVLYSAIIDALCKNGLVESAVALLDEMTKEKIRPNVVTYNTIIDAFGRSAAAAGDGGAVDESESGRLAVVPIKDVSRREVLDGCENTIIQIFGQLAAEKSLRAKKFNGDKQEMLCILAVYHKMHELDIKPNVVTFSAILNACSRCNSFEDASMLLKELMSFDNRVYGVAHGLLTGYRQKIWSQAESLFDEVNEMDSSTASAFYNALTDVLWHFGQKRGAQLVVLEGKDRSVWENVWSESRLDLHLMSSGAARAMVHAWMLHIYSNIFLGQELPKCLSILTGWGKHSKVVGDGTLKRTVEGLLAGMNSPFKVATDNLGRFISEGSKVAAWLRESETLKLLILEDAIAVAEAHDDKKSQANISTSLQLVTL